MPGQSNAAPTPSRWYPTQQQLGDTPSITNAFRILLDQHYALADAHAALLAKVAAPTATPAGPPPGSGPVDSQLLGLRVAPVDTQSLADGATLKFSKANGNFYFG